MSEEQSVEEPADDDELIQLTPEQRECRRESMERLRRFDGAEDRLRPRCGTACEAQCQYVSHVAPQNRWKRAIGSSADPYGLRTEQAIVESGVREVFTPHRPITLQDLLVGRGQHVRRIIEATNTPGQHAILYGDRGIGKSSVANVVSALLGASRADRHWVKRCDSDDTFESILSQPLAAVGAEMRPQEVEHQESSTKSIGLSVGASLGADRAATTTNKYIPNSTFSASYAAQALRGYRGSLLIDELDRVGDERTRLQLAEFIKHLSDEDAPFKVVVVGLPALSESLPQLHASLGRSVRQVNLERLSDADLATLVTDGGRRVSLEYEDDAVDAIAGLSAGFPEFTHLMALKTAEVAISEKRSRINLKDVRGALLPAAADAEAGLRLAYDSAVRSHSTDMFRLVLVAAAMIDKQPFAVRDLRPGLGLLTSGLPAYVDSLSAYFTRLVGSESDEDGVLVRVQTGVYQFRDPRMASFVRMTNGLLEQGVGKHRAT